MNYFQDPLGRLSGFIELGGPVVAILLILSVISLAAILFKLWQFTIARVGKSSGDTSAGDGSALGAIADEALRLRGQVVAKRISRGDAEDALATSASSQLRSLQSGFRLLDSIAQVSPLIGLFGTVLGMISAFQALQDAGNAVDPSVLAGGIWVALLTTAVGLAVAMPTSLALSYFESRVDRHRIAIQEIATAELNPAAPMTRASSAVTSTNVAGLADNAA
ncbi:MAG: MotA/TolQ/ExbB proton channel family protein [Pseudomonadota bacterium]